MPGMKPAASTLLLAGGIVLVFAGVSASLEFSPMGMIASLAAIAALLYAGAVWFGGAVAPLVAAGDAKVVVFDRALQIVAGGVPGASLVGQFPEPLRAEIDMRCRLALKGEHTHFACEHGGMRFSFEIAPVPSVHGPVLYGVLVSGSGARVPTVASSPAPTVA